MILQKINWKLFFENPAAAKPDDFFKVFNTWIPNSPEIFVDVADYQHIKDGPWTLLVGHYVDYALDHTDRRLGFLYSRKKGGTGNNNDRLKSSLKEFLQACVRLEEGPLFKGQVKLATNEFEFLINDRSLATNTKEDFEKIRPELANLFSKIYGDNASVTPSSADPQKRLTVSIKPKQSLSVKEILSKLN